MILTGPSSIQPAAMLATSRAILLDHREQMAVLVTSAAFLAGVLAWAWVIA